MLNEQVWLNFRGINYSCDIFLNGHKLNDQTFYGMFLRQQYNITQWLAKDGNNRLAVIVYPPDPVGDAQWRPGWRWNDCQKCFASICSGMGLDTTRAGSQYRHLG